VLALGVTQVIGFGTLYYAFALIVPAVAAEFSVRPSHLFAAFSVGLLLAGFLAPRIGRLMDDTGAPRIMAVGSVLAAAALVALAVAPNFATFAIALVVLEFIALAVLYDAAFASLAAIAGPDARRQITRLTLIAGFASTLFWPLTEWLTETAGWRATYLCFAAMHLFVAFPLHFRMMRLHAPSPAAGRQEALPEQPRFPLLPTAVAGRAFVFLALSFALSGLVISAMGVHMVSTLEASGLGENATAIAMMMGPAQVLSRIVEAVFGSRYHPLWTAILSSAALPLAMLMLVLPIPPLAAGIAFVVLSGMGQGLSSIVRGTVPLALFGAQGFGGMLGRLAVVRTTLSAGAAFIFALSVERLGFGATQILFAAIGFLALLPLPFLLAAVPRKI
jgi:MFS family permease